MTKIKLIDQTLLDETSSKAKRNARLRMNYNLHDTTDDPVNRLLNAMEPGTYVRPHRHTQPEKVESCIVLRGSLDMLIFDDAGNLTRRVSIDPEKGTYGFDIAPGIWHGLIVTSPETVVYEVKTGPYTPVADVDLAPWAPAADDEDGVREFLTRMKREVK